MIGSRMPNRDSFPTVSVCVAVWGCVFKTRRQSSAPFSHLASTSLATAQGILGWRWPRSVSQNQLS